MIVSLRSAGQISGCEYRPDTHFFKSQTLGVREIQLCLKMTVWEIIYKKHLGVLRVIFEGLGVQMTPRLPAG